MNIGQFIVLSSLADKSETDKVRLVVFFELKVNKKESFTINEICELLFVLGFAKPNPSRLKANILRSKSFVRGGGDNTFKLHLKEVQKLESEFPQLSEKSEEIISGDLILPEDLYSKTRGYVESLSRQINASFEYNIYDGCAVLMRRLIEILLISGFEYLGRKAEIEDGANGYKNLNSIINYAVSNKVFKISRDTEEMLDEFRQLGNFSAHKIQYNARRGDINKVKFKFRLAVEELLYQSGTKK